MGVLALYRMEAAQIGEELNVAMTAMYATEEGKRYNELLTKRSLAQDKVKKAEEAVRQIAEHVYRQHKETKPHPGILVKIKGTVKYEYASAAAWAAEHARGLLKLDTVKFEQHARAVRKTTPLDFVTYEDAPSVTLASNMAQYIEDFRHICACGAYPSEHRTGDMSVNCKGYTPRPSRISANVIAASVERMLEVQQRDEPF